MSQSRGKRTLHQNTLLIRIQNAGALNFLNAFKSDATINPETFIRNAKDLREVISSNRKSIDTHPDFRIFRENFEVSFTEIQTQLLDELGGLLEKELTESNPNLLQTIAQKSDQLQKLFAIDARPKDEETATTLLFAGLAVGLSALEIRKLIQSLIATDMDINKRIGPQGETLLHIAASLGDQESVDDLLEKGANLNIRDQRDRRPIDIVYEELEKISTTENINENVDGKIRAYNDIVFSLTSFLYQPDRSLLVEVKGKAKPLAIPMSHFAYIKRLDSGNQGVVYKLEYIGDPNRNPPLNNDLIADLNGLPDTEGNLHYWFALKMPKGSPREKPAEENEKNFYHEQEMVKVSSREGKTAFTKAFVAHAPLKNVSLDEAASNAEKRDEAILTELETYYSHIKKITNPNTNKVTYNSQLSSDKVESFLRKTLQNGSENSPPELIAAFKRNYATHVGSIVYGMRASLKQYHADGVLHLDVALRNALMSKVKYSKDGIPLGFAAKLTDLGYANKIDPATGCLSYKPIFGDTSGMNLNRLLQENISELGDWYNLRIAILDTFSAMFNVPLEALLNPDGADKSLSLTELIDVIVTGEEEVMKAASKNIIKLLDENSGHLDAKLKEEVKTYFYSMAPYLVSVPMVREADKEKIANASSRDDEAYARAHAELFFQTLKSHLRLLPSAPNNEELKEFLVGVNAQLSLFDRFKNEKSYSGMFENDKNILAICETLRTDDISEKLKTVKMDDVIKHLNNLMEVKLRADLIQLVERAKKAHENYVNLKNKIHMVLAKPNDEITIDDIKDLNHDKIAGNLMAIQIQCKYHFTNSNKIPNSIVKDKSSLDTLSAIQQSIDFDVSALVNSQQDWEKLIVIKRNFALNKHEPSLYSKVLRDSMYKLTQDNNDYLQLITPITANNFQAKEVDKFTFAKILSYANALMKNKKYIEAILERLEKAPKADHDRLKSVKNTLQSIASQFKPEKMAIWEKFAKANPELKSVWDLYNKTDMNRSKLELRSGAPILNDKKLTELDSSVVFMEGIKKLLANSDTNTINKIQGLLTAKQNQGVDNPLTEKQTEDLELIEKLKDMHEQLKETQQLDDIVITSILYGERIDETEINYARSLLTTLGYPVEKVQPGAVIKSPEQIAEERELIRNKAIEEAYETEDTFIKGVKLLVDTFYKDGKFIPNNPMLKTNKRGVERNFSPEDILALQYYLEPYRRLAEVGLDSKPADNKDAIKRFADLYNVATPQFEKYKAAIMDANINYLNFIGFINKMDGFPKINENGSNKDITDFAILTVQRIPRHEMLAQVLLKNTTEKDPAYPHLLRALDQVKAFTKHMNETVRNEGDADAKLKTVKEKRSKLFFNIMKKQNELTQSLYKKLQEKPFREDVLRILHEIADYGIKQMPAKKANKDFPKVDLLSIKRANNVNDILAHVVSLSPNEALAYLQFKLGRDPDIHKHRNPFARSNTTLAAYTQELIGALQQGPAMIQQPIPEPNPPTAAPVQTDSPAPAANSNINATLAPIEKTGDQTIDECLVLIRQAQAALTQAARSLRFFAAGITPEVKQAPEAVVAEPAPAPSPLGAKKK